MWVCVIVCLSISPIMTGLRHLKECYHHPLSVCDWTGHWNPICWLIPMKKKNISSWLYRISHLQYCQMRWEFDSMKNICLEGRLIKQVRCAKIKMHARGKKAAECNKMIHYAFLCLLREWVYLERSNPSLSLRSSGCWNFPLRRQHQLQQEIRWDRMMRNLFSPTKQQCIFDQTEFPTKDSVPTRFLLALPRHELL